MSSESVEGILSQVGMALEVDLERPVEIGRRKDSLWELKLSAKTISIWPEEVRM